MAGAFTTFWVGSEADAKLSFVSPTSPISPQVSDPAVRIVTAVDAPFLIKGVEIELVDVATGNAVSLGKAEHVNQSGTYELLWDMEHSPLPGAPPADGGEPPPEEEPPTDGEEPEEGSPVPDGSYKLRAKIIGTTTTKEASFTVNRTQADPSETAPQEWLDITSPQNGRVASFEGSAVKIAGLASPGTEGVDLFYSKAYPGTDISSWSSCGYADAGGGGSEPQPFEGTCTLAPADNPADVTAVAARSFDCVMAGCDAIPSVRLPGGGTPETGDAVRIIACTTSPCAVVSPGGWKAGTSTCQKVVVDVADFSGQPMADRAVDVLLEGPGSTPKPCGVGRSGASFPARPGAVARFTSRVVPTPRGSWCSGCVPT